jgi:hypothetical protein
MRLILLLRGPYRKINAATSWLHRWDHRFDPDRSVNRSALSPRTAPGAPENANRFTERYRGRRGAATQFAVRRRNSVLEFDRFLSSDG